MTYRSERVIRFLVIGESMNMVFYNKEVQNILGGIQAGDLA